MQMSFLRLPLFQIITEVLRKTYKMRWGNVVGKRESSPCGESHKEENEQNEWVLIRKSEIANRQLIYSRLSASLIMASTDNDGDSFAIFATAFSDACFENPSITSAETAS